MSFSLSISRPLVRLALPICPICKIPHRLETETSVSDDTRPQREVNCEIPHRFSRGKRNIPYKGVETSPSIRVLKILKRKLKQDNMIF